MTTRRTFVLSAVPAAVLLATSRSALAEAARLEETDAIAAALGYKHEASKVDGKKFPSYVVGRNCAGCRLFEGKAADQWAVCSAVGGKLVSAKGWCAAWSAKA